MIWLRLALVLVTLMAAIVIFSSCGSAHRTSWQLTERPAGTELHIGVAVGFCDSVDTVSVRETEEDVSLQAYINRHTSGDCPGGFRYQPHIVTLRDPIGDRPLLGCNPSDAVYGLGVGILNGDCGSTSTVLP